MAKPIPIKDIIAGVMSRYKTGPESAQSVLAREWKNIVPENAHPNSAPVKLNNKVLVVCVKNSCWAHELTLQKRILLKNIKKFLPQNGVEDVRFKVGENYNG